MTPTPADLASYPLEHTKLEQHGHVGLLTLNRPQAMNAISSRMMLEWNDTLALLDNNDDIRVIVITGAGKAFCAGADMSGGGKTFDKQTDMDFSSCPVTPPWRLRKPVIAAVNGHALGLGFSLALQCDFRFVADNAKYGLVQVQRGVLSDGCSHWLLPRLCGLQNALDILISGKTMNGSELLAKNLALYSLPNDQVLAAAMDYAHQLARNSAPVVAALAKRLVWQGLHQKLEDAEVLETRFLHHTMGQADAIEGGMAFFERRPPQWQGRLSQDWPDQDQD